MSSKSQESHLKLQRLSKSVGCPGPEIKTPDWLFFGRCPTKKKYGPYETEWNDKYDDRGKPLKEIMTTTKSCLPKVQPASNSTEECRKNPIYTRFRNLRHKRKEEIKGVEEFIYGNGTKGFKDLGRGSNSTRSELTSELWMDGALPLDLASMGKSSKSDSEMSGESRKNKTSMPTDLRAIIAKQGNPFATWAKPPRQTRQDKKKRKAAMQQEQESQMMSQAEERVDVLVQNLCDSIASLGGPDNNIEPQTIQHLFASGYDTTPAMSEGIALVKQAELPNALKNQASMSGSTVQQNEVNKVLGDTSAKAFKKIYKNGRHAHRYGAYYLQPKTWYWMRKDENLRDPRKKSWAEEIAELDVKREQMAEEMSHLHILNVYAEWLKIKGARTPECVLQAQKYRTEREERERLKAEAEAKAKHEYMMKKMRAC